MAVNIAKEIQEHGEQALKPYYLQLKTPFLQYAKRYTMDEDIRHDAFQEAFIAFYEYCLQGKFDPEKGTVKNLIFLMGRAYLINRLKKDRRQISDSDHLESHLQNQMDLQIQESIDSDSNTIKNSIQQLGEACQKLIIYFYYYNYSVEAIKERLGYKNENTVSSHKSRCLKQLKALMQKQ